MIKILFLRLYEKENFLLKKFKRYRIFFLISIIIDLLICYAAQYVSLIIFLCFFIFMKFFSRKHFFNLGIFFIFIFSLNYFFSYSVFLRELLLSGISLFDLQILNQDDSSIREIFMLDNKINIEKQIREILGSKFIFLKGIYERIFYYWSPDISVSLIAKEEYNDWLFHSLFFEFLINFGMIGLFALYFFIFTFLKHNKESFILLLYIFIIISLNSMDTFLFSHHYDIAIMIWFTTGLLNEKKI